MKEDKNKDNPPKLVIRGRNFLGKTTIENFLLKLLENNKEN